MKNKTFDQLMTELEAIVEALEKGDIPLEKAIDKYKEGIEAIKIMNDLLDNAKKQIKIVTGQADGDQKDE